MYFSRAPLLIVVAVALSNTSFASEAKFQKAAAQYAAEIEKSKPGVERDEKEMALATSLQQAGMPLAALKIFEKIVNAKKPHSQHNNVISALAGMATNSDIELLVSQLLMPIYDNDPEAMMHLDADKKQSVNYLAAKRMLKLGKASEAAKLAQTLQPNHPFYAKAQYLLGLNNLNNYKEAIANFDNVLLAISASTKNREQYNLRNLALLAEGRVYYEQAYALPEDNPNRKVLANKAIELYRQVPRFSNAWSHALFEMGWAYTMLDDYGDALGAVRSLQHPYFANAYYPEAEILSSLVYWYNCQWDRATLALTTWKKKYEPISKSLKDAVNTKGQVPTLVGEDLKSNPQYRVFNSLLQGMHREKALLTTNEYFKSSLLPKQLNDYYERAENDLKKTEASWTKQRLSDMLGSLEQLQTRGSIIYLETKTAESKWLDQGRQIAGQKRERLARPYVPVDKNQFWWVSSKESWKDELGYYRLSVKSECYE